jgi:cell division transport system ATP-binding protein
MALIKYEKVSKEYVEGKPVLSNISFEIYNGEFVFIVGRSGAGKSTLIKLLNREIVPTEGTIIFKDRNIAELTFDDLPEHRRDIGIVFQDFKLLESKTVYENVAISLEVVEASESEIKNIVPNTIKLVGLSDKVNSYPNELSGGEKQRVAIARALAHEPDVLVADEATGMIDPDSADDILALLEKINELGTTVIMSTHDERIVDQMEKRVIRIEGGKMVSDKRGGKYRE